MQFWTLHVNHKYIFQIKGARNIADQYNTWLLQRYT